MLKCFPLSEKMEVVDLIRIKLYAEVYYDLQYERIFCLSQHFLKLLLSWLACVTGIAEENNFKHKNTEKNFFKIFL